MIDKDKIKPIWDEVGYDMKICTCVSCPDNKDCIWAWDLYNISGDCLASK